MPNFSEMGVAVRSSHQHRLERLYNGSDLTSTKAVAKNSKTILVKADRTLPYREVVESNLTSSLTKNSL
jgi:biopolymer transport protein ExbD